jgi:hypothetical protein
MTILFLGLGGQEMILIFVLFIIMLLVLGAFFYGIIKIYHYFNPRK